MNPLNLTRTQSWGLEMKSKTQLGADDAKEFVSQSVSSACYQVRLFHLSVFMNCVASRFLRQSCCCSRRLALDLGAD